MMLSNLWQRCIHSFKQLGNHEALGKLGDFTATGRIIPISLLAIGIGVLSAFVALILLRLIGLFTNLFFFQRWSTDLVSPVGNRLGLWEIFVPVIGALIIGAMARFGSERIRGHGIPEAIVSLYDLLKARTRNLEEERQRERHLHIRQLLPSRNHSTNRISN